VALVGLVARAAAGPPEDFVLFCYLTKKMSFFSRLFAFSTSGAPTSARKEKNGKNVLT
jgi:hypothetical protein